jgi:hypothetical protein
MYETNEIYRDYSVEFADKSTKWVTYSDTGTGINFAGIDALLFNLSEFRCVKIVTFIHRQDFWAFFPGPLALNLPKSADTVVCGQDSIERIGHLRQKACRIIPGKRTHLLTTHDS